ncbi:MAG: hypothetical protein QM688_16155 [Sphingomonas bacterium]
MAGPDQPLTFSYSRALAPPLWAFVFIMGVELLVVHILVAGLWSHVAALVLSVISIAMIAWIVTIIRGLSARPAGGRGRRHDAAWSETIPVPAAQIAALATSWPREKLQARGVLNLALINYPNVMLELDPPLGVANATSSPSPTASTIPPASPPR